jgi:hypothetical protein
VSEAASPAAFAAALAAVLDRVLDPRVAARLERVYGAADRCVAGLRSIDLTALEREEEDGAADLGLWEQVAPTVGQTLSHVSALIQTIDADFPDQGGDDGIEISVDDDSEIDPAESAKAEEAAFAVRAARKVIQQQVGQLGMGVRNPDIVASRWQLLNLLQASMGRFYGAIGDMVFASAVAFGEVKRAEIVPYHAEMLRESLALRRAAVDLGRVSVLYKERLKTALLSDMPPLLEQLERNLASFSKTPAFRSLWARDKQQFLVHRNRLRTLAAGSQSADEIRAAGISFSDFVVSLAGVNQRVLLKDHDREVAASCAMRLEQAELQRQSAPEQAAQVLGEVLRDAWSLYGRDPELDAYLREVKKRGAASFTAEALAQEIAQATQLVARVPLALFAL